MKKILTVVIPTYNIEKYIKTCLDSFVLPEILEDLEVLIISDGSKDRSVELASAYVRKYPETFRIIEKENGGHGSTINRGMAEAAGRYFKVVDGDDWVEQQAFIKLIRCLKETDSDVVLSNYYWYHDGNGSKKPEFKEPFPGVVYGKEYAFSEISNQVFMKMHAFTIKTELLRKHMPPIDEHCFYVDMEFVLFPIPYIQTVTCIDAFVYMYRIGLPGQSMNMKSMRRNEENYDRVLKRLLHFYREQKQAGAPEHILVYLENSIGRMIASRFKIFLSFPYEKAIEEKMRHFDKRLLKEYPDVYAAVRNRAVLVLRRTNYKAYFVAQKAFAMKERTKK